MAVVAGDERERIGSREIDEDLVERALFGEAVVLQLHEEVPGLEALAQLAERVAAGVLALHQDLLRDEAAHAAAEADDSLVVLAQDGQIDPRPARALDPAEAHQAREVSVALLAR